VNGAAAAPLPTIAEAAASIAGRTLTPIELVEQVIRRLESSEPVVHAYASVDPDAALAAAEEATREIATDGPRGPLHGIPVNLKDIFLTRDLPTAAGSKVLRGYRPDEDSAVAGRLKRAGAIVVGKTVTHEFAYGQNVVPTRNPWDLDRYCGGSSAGAGVSIAVGSALGAMGTDTGGSLRLPAAMNGVSALKPTFGRVSTAGVIPLSPTMDHAGPAARTVEDVSILLTEIAGFDPADPGASRRPVPRYAGELKGSIKGLRIGVDRDYYFSGVGEPLVLSAVEAAIEVLSGLGAELVEVNVPELEHATTVAETIVLAEAATVHRASVSEHADQYDPRTRLRLEVGQLILATDYLSAQRVRRQLQLSMRDTFRAKRLDALVGPTLGTLPILVADLPSMRPPSKSTLSLPWLRYTGPFNVTGQPALTVPCGEADGLPIAMQIAGRPWDEITVLKIGHAYQTATDWHKRIPLDIA
jgi:aspartyl-tRNA(Asn)/glutamyl-tRNA(Gln) amidotransferase subunit A